MTEFLYWLVAIFTVGRTVTGRVLGTALAGKTKLELVNMAAVAHDGASPLVPVLTPLAEEGLQHVLCQLDDVDVPGLRSVQAGHVFFLLTSQLGVVEEVTVGTPIEEALEQRMKCKIFLNASLEIYCCFLEKKAYYLQVVWLVVLAVQNTQQTTVQLTENKLNLSEKTCFLSFHQLKSLPFLVFVYCNKLSSCSCIIYKR